MLNLLWKFVFAIGHIFITTYSKNMEKINKANWSHCSARKVKTNCQQKTDYQEKALRKSQSMMPTVGPEKLPNVY